MIDILRYTEPNRNDGAWEGEASPPDSDNSGYPTAEVFVRRNTKPMYGSHKPVCTIEDPDFAEGGSYIQGIHGVMSIRHVDIVNLLEALEEYRGKI